MKHATRLLSSALSLATLLASSPGAAQSPSRDPQTAAEVERLYKEAVREMGAGKHDVACPKLVQTVRLAPATAIGARIKLAECYEQWGKLASAWAEYLGASEAASRAGQADRSNKAQAKATELRARVALLKIEAPPAQRALPGFALSLDGAALDAARAAVPVPVDRGAHSLVASAPGYESRTVRVEIEKDGAEATVVLPLLDAEKALSPPSTSTPVPGPAPRSLVPGFVAGGVGLAAAVVGAALVGVAAAKLSDNVTLAPRDESGDPLCRKTPSPGESPTCATLRSNADFANGPGNAGIGILAGGGVLMAAGALWLLIPSSPTAEPRTSRLVPIVGKDGGGLVLTGSF
jgi:hypothetical protein